MTPQIILIALVAGATSMVLLAAGLTGTSLALPLMILSPLPIAIASLGWGSVIGFIAAVVAFMGLSLIATPTGGLLFIVLFGLPIAYLAHLAGLSRQDDPDQAEEWFPESTILWRAVLIGGATVGLAFMISGFDAEEVTKRGLSEFAPTLEQLDTTTRETMENAIRFQVKITPYSMPMAWLLVMWLNLSLGIKIAKVSDRFNRPSFFLKMAELPNLVIPVFGAAVLLSLISPPLSFLGAAFFGIIIMAITILGFNTVHVATAHLPMRGVLLASLYMAVLILSIPILLVFGIGIADHFFKIRQRYRLANPHSPTNTP
ncbi:MAG: hypothetical protein ABJN78_06765 [Hyphomicrobiales bacterium]